MITRRTTFTVLGLLAIGLGILGAFYFGILAERRGLVDGLPIPGADGSNGRSVVSKREDQSGPQTAAQKQHQLLIQSYLLALAQANLTGNFSVLHALGAPAFQKNNPPQKLSAIFAGLRQQKVDLTPLIFYKPVLKREPWRDDKGMLRLVGHYPTEPKQIDFDLTLQPVSGVWRLFGISVNAVPAKNDDTAKQ